MVTEESKETTSAITNENIKRQVKFANRQKEYIIENIENVVMQVHDIIVVKCIHHWLIEATEKKKKWLHSICKKCNATRLHKQSMVNGNNHEVNITERLAEEARRAERAKRA